ncbi:hypothetical protein D3C75_915860 [compost metagenome]
MPLRGILDEPVFADNPFNAECSLGLPVGIMQLDRFCGVHPSSNRNRAGKLLIKCADQLFQQGGEILFLYRSQDHKVIVVGHDNHAQIMLLGELPDELAGTGAPCAPLFFTPAFHFPGHIVELNDGDRRCGL